MRTPLSLLAITTALAANLMCASTAAAHRDPTAFEPTVGNSVALGLGVGPTYGMAGYVLELERARESRDGFSVHIAAGERLAAGGHYWFAGRKLQIGVGISAMGSTLTNPVTPGYDGRPVTNDGQPGREDGSGSGSAGGTNGGTDGSGGNCGGGGGTGPCADSTSPPNSGGGPPPGPDNGSQGDWGELGSASSGQTELAVDIMIDHDIGRPGRWGARYGIGWFVSPSSSLAGIALPSVALSRKF
jgi:hypothetical protein